MSTYRKLSLIRIGGMAIAIATVGGKQHVLVNQETNEIVREVNRLLGLRRCTVCGGLVRAEDLGYVEIINNKVTKAICNHCLAQLTPLLTC